MTIPTVTEINNIKVDADAFAEMVNGDEYTEVQTRYGGVKPSVTRAVALALAASGQTSPVTSSSPLSIVTSTSDNISVTDLDNNKLIRVQAVSPVTITVSDSLTVGNVCFIMQDTDETISFVAGSNVTLLTPAGTAPYTRNSIVGILALSATEAVLFGELA